jgi:hypothetical protein
MDGPDIGAPSTTTRPDGDFLARHGVFYRVLAKLEQPRVRLGAIVLGLLLVVPSLFSGFALDDFVLLEQLANKPGKAWAGRSPLDLFRWIDPSRARVLIDGHGVPWWTYDRALLAFMRPLSSLSHALDYVLWPNSALAMHVHSWLWFALLLGVAAAAYRWLIGNRWTFGVAVAMFAVDSAHGATVGWISNRNSLISGVFAIAALLCHHRGRLGPSRGYAWGAWLCLGISLFAAELGLAGAAYLLAYALWYERGSWAARARSLVPYAVLLVGWAWVRHAGDYGSVGGFASYVDPLREPLRFLQVLPVRVSLLLASQLVHWSADFYTMGDAAMRPYVLAAAVYECAVMTWFLWPSLRADRASRFLFAGGVLSAVPLAAATAGDRLLTLVGFGMLPVIADALRRALDIDVAAYGQRIHRLRKAGAVALVGLHLVVDPVLLPVVSLSTKMSSNQVESIADSIPAQPADAERVVFVAEMPRAGLLTYVPSILAARGHDASKLYSLFGADWAARFERRGERGLRVTSERGFFSEGWDLRSPQLPFHRGDRIELAELTISVVDVTADGRPRQVDFSFRDSLESQRYVWLSWHDGRLVPFRPPLNGEGRVIAAR